MENIISYQISTRYFCWLRNIRYINYRHSPMMLFTHDYRQKYVSTENYKNIFHYF